MAQSKSQPASASLFHQSDKQDKNASCKRCGTCCMGGGPAFHLADQKLIDEGIFPATQIYTIRQGEPVRDFIRSQITTAPTDIIKVKSADGTHACGVYDKQQSECTVYEDRPSECRAQKCWDPSESMNMYDKDRLTRKDLLSNVEGLWQVVEDHQKRCAYDAVLRFVEAKDETERERASEEVLSAIQYDVSLRSLVVEKMQLDPNMLEFLFGRPMLRVISLFGLVVEQTADGLKLRKKSG
jgi:Fe-S-cluster containining protein